MSAIESDPIAPRTGAFLDAAGLAELERPSLGFEYKKEIDLPGYPAGKILCIWRASFRPDVGALDASVTFRDPETHVDIGEAWIDNTSKEPWHLYHRYVPPELRGKGIGAYLLASIEDFARNLHRRDPDHVPHTLQIQGSQPSVVRLAMDNGYLMSSEDMMRWNKFIAERDADPKEFKETGELPSFFAAELELVDEYGAKRDERNRDMVIIESALFDRNGGGGEYTLVPSINGGLPLIRMRYRHHGASLPFLLSVTLTKDLEA